MSGQNPQMNRLKVRKQLLVAESEVLRNQLVRDIELLRNGLGSLKEQAQAATSRVSIAGAFMAAFSAFRQARNGVAGGGAADVPAAKSSLISSLLNGVRTAAAVWSALRSK